jgi:hypothetical protein
MIKTGEVKNLQLLQILELFLFETSMLYIWVDFCNCLLRNVRRSYYGLFDGCFWIHSSSSYLMPYRMDEEARHGDTQL